MRLCSNLTGRLYLKIYRKTSKSMKNKQQFVICLSNLSNYHLCVFIREVTTGISAHKSTVLLKSGKNYLSISISLLISSSLITPFIWSRFILSYLNIFEVNFKISLRSCPLSYHFETLVLTTLKKLKYWANPVFSF